MSEISVDECKRLAATYLSKNEPVQAQAYAVTGLLVAVSGFLAAASEHQHPVHEVAVRVAMAAEAFFTQPSDAGFAEVSASLDEWQAVRGGELNV